MAVQQSQQRTIDGGKFLVAVLLAGGSLLYVFLGGLMVPPPVVVAGLVVWVPVIGVMVWQLRRGSPYALAVPIVYVVVWQVLVVLGMFLFGWTP